MTSALISACSEKSEPKAPQPQIHVDTSSVNTILPHDFLSVHEKDFRIENEKNFRLSDSIIENRATLFVPIKQQEHEAVFQDGSPYSADALDLDYLYSKHSTDSSLKEFTLLESFDRYCYILSYRIYGKDGKLINAFPLAIRCDDENFHVELKGKFLSETQYQSISVEREIVRKEGEAPYEQYDSLVRVTDILPDGTIRESTVDSLSKRIPIKESL